MNISNMRITLFWAFLWTMSLLFLFPDVIRAESESKVILESNCFAVNKMDKFSIEDEYAVDEFSFNSEPLGEFTITGVIDKESSMSDMPAFITDDSLEIHYTYAGELHTDNPDEWHICSGNTNKIDELSLDNNIGGGTLIIQKSSDGKTWKNTSGTSYDFLNKNKDNLIVYEINDKERIAGTYFRIMLAYEVKKRTQENSDISLNLFGAVDVDVPVDIPFYDADKYDYYGCVQKYEFYVCSTENPVVIKDIISGVDVSKEKAVDKGFQIDKRKSKSKVNVTFEGELKENVKTYESFYESGEYKIDVVTPVGQSYQYVITIENGLQFEELHPTVYENKKKNGYKESGKVNDRAVTGVASYSVLKLGYGLDDTCTKGTCNDKNKTTAYGITGENVCFFLNLEQKKKMKENGWVTKADSWGKNKSEKIYDVATGEIETGAIIVQTSADGKNWTNQENLGYEYGLYNTDFENYYGAGRDVLIYTPSGQDIIKGVYLRVIYAYLAHGTEKETDYRYLENYTFYLCNNELGAVTIHNLTAEEQMAEILEEKSDASSEIYSVAEDMLSGSGTVTGFTIDNSLNPLVNYTVEKDGEALKIIGGESFDKTGRYDIKLSNFLGNEEQRTIYVDRLSTEEAYDLYFGDSFVDGKRIYSEEKYPVYVGGEVSYHLNPVSDSFLPLNGRIKNLNTAEETEIKTAGEEINRTLVTPGLYEIVLTNNPFSEGDEQSGDYRVFTFHFTVIAEEDCPGPVINKNNLTAFNIQNVSGCNPHAYALMFSSASKGTITLVFSSYEAAYDYAVKYESGTVEKQKDGSYRYTGSFLVNKKTEYNSNWDVNDAIDYFARLSVQDWYFDMSDEYTYLTMEDSILKSHDNLRKLELDKSVVIFASEEDRNTLADIEALPMINSLPYAYLKPGKEGEVDRGKNHFEFIKDENGWDSDKVTIIDQKENEYPITYDQDVDEQLKAYQCIPGIVTVHEETVYGNSADYKAVYIPEGKNLASVAITYIANGEEKTEILEQKNDGLELTADSFRIISVQDETDPFSVIKITNEKEEIEYYTPGTITEKDWIDSGRYQLKFINRLGYFFTIKVVIENGNETDISFSGEGADSLQSFTVTFGEQNIKLPDIERYGYDFAGYRDSYGNMYTDEIAQILYKGSLVLETVWEPKMVKIVLERPDGAVYRTDEAYFGTDYRIGAYISENKNEHFNGWIYEGELYTDTIRINKEDDYILQVSIDEISFDEEHDDQTEEILNESATESREIEAESTEEDNEKSIKETDKGGFGIIFGTAAIVVALAASVIIFKKKSINKED